MNGYVALASGQQVPDYLLAPNAGELLAGPAPVAHQWTERVGKFQSDDTPVPIFNVPLSTVGTNLTLSGNLVVEGTTSTSPPLTITGVGFGDPGAFGVDSLGDKVILYNDGSAFDARIGIGTFADVWLKAFPPEAGGQLALYLDPTNPTVVTISLSEGGIGCAAGFSFSAGVRMLSGAGAPSASVPNGSTYQRSDGVGITDNFYVHRGGAWVGIA